MMAASAKDLQLRELKDTVSQLKMMISEQTELINSLREVIDTKSEMEQILREQNRLLQEQIDYLTKKLFAPSSEKHSAEIPGQLHLKYVLEQRPDNTWTDEQLSELALWSEKLQSIKKSHTD